MSTAARGSRPLDHLGGEVVGVPMIRVALVRRGASTSRAMPKSDSLARGAPPGPGEEAWSSRMFSGLTSRWTMPAACATARPSATSAAMETAACGVSGPSRSSRERRSEPVHQLHHQGEGVPVHDQVVDADDARVVEAGERGPLLDETADQDLVRGQVLAQQFDRDRALGAVAEPDCACGATADHLVRGVAATDLACQGCSVRGCGEAE